MPRGLLPRPGAGAPKSSALCDMPSLMARQALGYCKQVHGASEPLAWHVF